MGFMQDNSNITLVNRQSWGSLIKLGLTFFQETKRNGITE
jgi:hypothetical protein